jgi:hypothetical protein
MTAPLHLRIKRWALEPPSGIAEAQEQEKYQPCLLHSMLSCPCSSLEAAMSRKALLHRGGLLPSSLSSSLGVEISANLHFSPAHLSVASSPYPSGMTGEIGVDKLGSGSGPY